MKEILKLLQKIFRKEQPKKLKHSYSPYDDMSEEEIDSEFSEAANFHEECGDR